MRSTTPVAVAAVLVAALGIGALVGRQDAPEPQVRAASPTASTPTPQPTRTPLLPALPSGAPAPTAAGLAAVLAGPLAAPALGRSVSVSVVDAATGAVLVDRGAGSPVTPASTLKVATAVAVLTGLAPDQRLSTRALAGPGPGDVVLVGGGDATLAGPAAGPTSPPVARLADLAAQVVAARGGSPVGRVLVDDTAYNGPATGQGWRPTYVSGGDVAPVGALALDAGRVDPAKDARVSDPALAAGTAFARLLGAPAAQVLRGTAASGAASLGVVESPTVAQLVERMLTDSDNDLAETLARQLAIAKGQPPTFAGGAAAVRATLTGIVPDGTVVPVDGSGLSRDDRLQPAALTALLVRAAREPRLAPVLSGLPVAGFDGTLGKRFRTGGTVPAAGEVRAKTGTLEGVSALAGLVRTADGRLLAFDVSLGAVPVGATRAAEAALDAVATELSGCGCR